MTAPLFAANLPYRIVALDELSAIYHRASGATHVVIEPVPQILATLEAGALDADALYAKLSIVHDLGSEAEARLVLDDRLNELVTLGLVTIT